jgi:hypothetical protein
MKFFLILNTKLYLAVEPYLKTGYLLELAELYENKKMAETIFTPYKKVHF